MDTDKSRLGLITLNETSTLSQKKDAKPNNMVLINCSTKEELKRHLSVKNRDIIF